MDTKQNILYHARCLFNEQGAERVSIREIGRAAGISHGNLRYHYPGKAHLLEALFQECFDKSSAFTAGLLQSDINFAQLLRGTWQEAKGFWEYRFLLIDLISLCRNYPEVQRGFQQMYQQREQEILLIFRYLAARKWIHPAPYSGYYELVIQNFLMAVDYGLSHVLVKYPDTPQEVLLRKYHLMWYAPLIGCLTVEGLDLLKEVLDLETGRVKT